MNWYIVYDSYGDYLFNKPINAKKLRQLAIDEIKEYTLENNEEIDTLKEHFEIMEKLINDEYIDTDYLVNVVKGFGWGILDLNDLYTKLRKYLKYLTWGESPTENLKETLKMLEQDMK